MSVFLLNKPGIGVIAANPAPSPVVDFDDIVAASGATHHGRLLAGAGTAIEDVIGSVDWTVTNTIGWQRGALVTNANGGNSAFFNGIGVTPTYAAATNLLTNATWAVAFVLQFDAVQGKAVLLDSGTADGGYSIEVESDGAGGMRTRQFTRATGAQVMASVGAVPTSDAIALFFLQVSDAVNGGRFFYVGDATGLTLIAQDVGIKTFTAVPAGTHYLGAWNLTGGLQTAFKGLIGEVIAWNGLVPVVSQMEAIAAEVQNVVFAQNITAGTVEVGQTLSIDVGAVTNPAEDFTPVKLSDPAAGGGTVAVVGEDFQVTGHSVADDYSFTYRIDRGSLMSSTATIAYTVIGGGASVTGIQLPAFENQTHSDAVPGGAIWWNPDSGNDANNGSTEALAVETFTRAQVLVSAGGTIVVPGGAYVVPELTFTKSGTGSGNRIKLMSKPSEEVVFYREGDFVGGLERTWTWTVVDAGLGIWQSPNIGINTKTLVNSFSGGAADPTNALWGFMVIPNGAHGCPHLMRMMFYDLDGTREPNAFHHPNTGGSAGNGIRDGGYGGPGFYAPGNGRVQVRMQKAAQAYQGNQWPTDGRMGTCTNSSGLWQEPVSEDPNDYAFHITRFAGDLGGSGPILLNMNGQSWWHVKGINGALCQRAVVLEAGSENNWFEKCTWYPHSAGAQFFATTRNNKFTRCMLLSGDWRSLSWQEGKGDSNYWFQHLRNVGIQGRASNANMGAGTLWEHCTFFGWFDWALSLDSMDGRMTFDHCAALNNTDDGIMQTRSDLDHAFDLYYCYVAGGPIWSGNSNFGAGSKDWYIHHCVIDIRIPMLWGSLGMTIDRRGVMPNSISPTHANGSSGPMYIRKMWNCTIITSPDIKSGNTTMVLGTSEPNHNVPANRAHEVYNTIVAVIDNRRYPMPNGSKKDGVMCRLSCQKSTAGTQRYDYNCYYRSVPSPVSTFCLEIQDSQNTNREGFASLAAYRSSSKKTLSESMYASATGAFSGSNGTDGHEEHGVQVNPGFVDLANRDYRPTHASVIAGALNVSTSGWPGAADAHNWKGACDPNGDGTEIGPQ